MSDAFSGTLAAELNGSIAAGDWTYIFDLAGVGHDASYVQISGRIYEGARLLLAPTFDGGDVWPVTHESLAVPGDRSQPKAFDDASYVNDHVWVGRPSRLVLRLPIAGTTFDVRLEQPVVTMRLSADRTKATGGVIAGVIPVETFIEEQRKFVATVEQRCPDATLDQMIDEMVRESADILVDGTIDPERTCDGISFGMGFEAARVNLGNIAEPAPSPALCPSDGQRSDE